LHLQSGNAGAASEALQSVIAVNPLHVGALELLLDRASREGNSFELQSIDELIEPSIAASTRHQRDVAGLVLAHDLPRSLHALAETADTVTREMLALHGGRTPGAVSAEARVRLALARPELEPSGMLDQQPIDIGLLPAVRIGIRTASREGLRGEARRLLRVYLDVRPDDKWALAQMVELSKPPQDWQIADESMALVRQGYPFPVRRETLRYTPDPRRIAYLLHNSLPYTSAGYATRTHGILSALKQIGWQVEGVTRPGYPFDMQSAPRAATIPASNDVDGIVYHHLSQTPEATKKHPLPAYINLYATKIETLALEMRPSLIHAASNHWNGLAAVVAARRLGIPSLYEVRGLWELTKASRDRDWANSDAYAFMASMEYEAANAADHVFTLTSALRDILVERGVDSSKITLAPNAVDTSRFFPRPADTSLRAQLGLQGRTVIGYAGSLLEYEGIDVLLEATALLKHRHDLAVLIVGSGPAATTLERMVRELDIETLVTFTGPVPHADVSSHLSLMDVVVIPRKGLPVTEAVSPMKPFEAMAAGIPVVASDVAAIAEIIRDGETGLLHRKDDPQSLAQVLERLLEDSELASRLAIEARAWVERERTWTSVVGEVDRVYKKMLEMPPGSRP